MLRTLSWCIVKPNDTVISYTLFYDPDEGFSISQTGRDTILSVSGTKGKKTLIMKSKSWIAENEVNVPVINRYNHNDSTSLKVIFHSVDKDPGVVIESMVNAFMEDAIKFHKQEMDFHESNFQAVVNQVKEYSKKLNKKK